MAHTSRQLLRGSTLRLISLVVSIGVGFYMLPFLVHALGDGTYGIWVLVGSIFGFYGLLGLGMGAAGCRYLFRAIHGGDEKDVNATLSSTVFLFSVAGLVSLLITLLIILAVPFFTKSAEYITLFQTLIAIIGIKTAIQFPLWPFDGVLWARYRYDITSIINISTLVIRTALIIAFINMGYGIITVAIITSLTGISARLVTIYYARVLVPGIRVARSFVNLDKLKDYYQYGKYAFISSVADKTRYSIDGFVVAGIVGIGLVTHYIIAITLINYFGQVMHSIFGVMSPVLNKYHKQKQWDTLREAFFVFTELTTLVAVFIGGALITLGNPFISIWMGEGYDDTYIVLLILCAGSIIANSQTSGVAALYAIARHKYYAKITSIEALVNLSASIILARYIGIYGVAIGTAVPLLFNQLVMLPLYTCKQLDIPVKNYYRLVSRILLAGAAMFIPYYLIMKLAPLDSYPKLIAAGSFITMVYAIISVRYIISDNTMRYLHEMMPHRMQYLIRAISRNTQHEF